MYEVVFSKRAREAVSLLPMADRKRLNALVDALRASGPMQPAFRNFSKLGKNDYHCHLSYHWVACWTVIGGRFKIEVYYVGSREKAPY